jgi:hypothetical protein
MVAASRAAAGMGYVGYPAHIFYMKLFFDRQESHFKRLWTLEQWYSDLRGYLPMFYESKPDEYEKIYPKIQTIDERINDTWGHYEQRYDNAGTWDPDELKFNRMVVTVMRDLDEITSLSRVIDKQKMADEEFQV